MKAMIRLCVLVCAVLCVNSLFAQEEEGNGFLFPQFEKGVVVTKKGVRTPASLNYNMLQQTMVFIDKDSVVLEFANMPDILFVTIGERKFFPVSANGVFYEQVSAGNGSFFIQHIAYMLSAGRATGYGGYSQTTASTSLGSIQTDSHTFTKLKPDEKFKMIIENNFYLKSGNKYKRFNTAKALGKLFKGQSVKIEEYAKKNAIDFKNADDVANIVEYGFGLMEN